MTQEEIIRMAREADVKANTTEAYKINQETYDWLERFAALVAAHEREKQVDISALPIIIEAAVKEAVLAEREACAKVCDGLVLDHPARSDLTADQCAAAIRARGDREK